MTQRQRKDRHNGTGYSELFATAHIPFLVVSSVLARMPLGSSVMLVVLLVSSHYDAAAAGSATALMTGVMAVCAPLFGKLIDLGKAPVSLIALGVLQFAGIIGLVISAMANFPVIAVYFCSLLTGITTPPVAGTTRSLWSSTVSSQLVPVAYDLEVLIVDVLYVAGPLMASMMMVIFDPGMALGLVYGLMACGCILLAMSRPVRNYAATVTALSSETESHRPLLGDANVVCLLLVCLFTGAFSGWVETAVPLFYSQLQQTALSGMAISIWSIGSIVGILLFTRFHPKHATTTVQLTLFTGLYCLACALLILPHNAYSLIAILFLVGVAVSPGTSLQYQLAGQLTPQNRQGEMFSWVNTAMGVGLAIGSFGAGQVADGLNVHLLFLLPVGFVMLATGAAGALLAHSGVAVPEER
ncbi:MFS transporter [Bifidobacterium biavatii]|uniref:MFS transporter n=1 Tax=Bifidobacterium biavatii DSM 23969 TaxID=1437608 RepID=A0A087A1T2_9BIFI|nr:MFS transporter [Bifidobacterium biavatii]KFI52732.1 MFS transporter [Bifidobacterium biavatii DSM 23969]